MAGYGEPEIAYCAFRFNRYALGLPRAVFIIPTHIQSNSATPPHTGMLLQSEASIHHGGTRTIYLFYKGSAYPGICPDLE